MSGSDATNTTLMLLSCALRISLTAVQPRACTSTLLIGFINARGSSCTITSSSSITSGTKVDNALLITSSILIVGNGISGSIPDN